MTTLLRVPQLPYLYVMPACVVEDNEGRWGVAGHPLGRDEAEVAQGIVAELWRGPNSTEMLWFLESIWCKNPKYQTNTSAGRRALVA